MTRLDRETPEDYRSAFTYFVSDVRNDLAKKIDSSLSNLPILVGEISKTYNSASEQSVAFNTAFIQMQDSLPNSIANLYVNASGNMDENQMVDGKNIIVGSDNYHWNYTDQLTIGNMVGDWIKNTVLA